MAITKDSYDLHGVTQYWHVSIHGLFNSTSDDVVNHRHVPGYCTIKWDRINSHCRGLINLNWKCYHCFPEVEISQLQATTLQRHWKQAWQTESRNFFVIGNARGEFGGRVKRLSDACLCTHTPSFHAFQMDKIFSMLYNLKIFSTKCWLYL